MAKKITKKVKSGETYVVVSRTKNGAFVVGGTIQSQLVNKHPGIKVRNVKVHPKNLTKSEISQMVKAMKVA